MEEHYYTKGLMDVTDDIIMRVAKHRKRLTKYYIYYYIKKARNICLKKAKELEKSSNET